VAVYICQIVVQTFEPQKKVQAMPCCIRVFGRL